MMDTAKIKKAVLMILEAIGEDPKREGLKETPERVARMYEDFFSGLHKNPKDDLKTTYSQEHDEIILLKDISFYSICEHHLLPFLGKAHVAYIPEKNRVVGLSKLARVVETVSKKPQMQERLTSEIANTIMESLKPKGVIVVIHAEHLCMTMRGIKKPGSHMVTSAVKGIFRKNSTTRAEAFALING
ncbi:MAG: GTP cyclohydrolase I FolE [Candidatus Firestonebacteria bacterium]